MKKNLENQLHDLKWISEISDLTMQDVIGAMTLLIRSGKLRAYKSIWMPQQFNACYEFIADADYPENKQSFIDAVKRTRFDRMPKQKPQTSSSSKYEVPTSDDFDFSEDEMPETNMDYVSKQLLKDDDVFFNESILFNNWKTKYLY